MQAGISVAFSQIKDELTDHLDSINQNTTEFESVYKRLDAFEKMIEKLTERVDCLAGKDQSLLPQIKQQESITLNLREQEFFLTLYTATETYTASEYARYLGLTEELVHALAHRLIGKGIPVLKETDEIGRVCYMLDNSFKELQAKQNIIPINTSILQQFNLREDEDYLSGDFI